MDVLETVQTVLGYVQDVVVILLAVVAWLMNRKLGRVTKTKTSTESNKVDSAENKKIAEDSAQEVSMQSDILETPVTTVKRDLRITLNEAEVDSLRQVIEASGRSSEVKDLYQAITTFVHSKK